MFNIYRLLLVLFCVLPAGIAFSEDEPVNSEEIADQEFDAVTAPQTDRPTYNFDWLDPDKKIYVLQNRVYTKARKLTISVGGGLSFASAYRNSYDGDLRAGYFFTEELGIEAFGQYFTNSENNTFEGLKVSVPTLLPVVREPRFQMGGLLHWAPWYAKINIFNSIVYFDWLFNVGVGTVSTRLDTRTNVRDPVSYLEQNYVALYAGTGHQYHLSRSLFLRLDYLGSYYRAPLQYGVQNDQVWTSNHVINFGFGARI